MTKNLWHKTMISRRGDEGSAYLLRTSPMSYPYVRLAYFLRKQEI